MNNMYVSKDLAIILKEKGFNNAKNDSLCYYYELDELTKFPNKWHIINYEKSQFILAPIEQEVVDWIFDEIGLESNPNTHIDYERKRLKFWYTTLLEHKFSLMHEFIGRLEDWFEDNNIELFYYNSNWNIVTTNRTIQFNSNLPKKESKYKAILKMFELIENNEYNRI